MAFKKTPPSSTVPDSPEKLFLDLPRRKIPDVMPHQNEIMKIYAEHGVNDPDVALQLPTGSGKTLVGLLIAEWRRRKFGERVIYLCPTKQLVNQVVEQAEEKYGLTVLGFTGKIKDYDPNDKAKYHNADHIAITTYNSLFNTNPFFGNADVIIIDDAHAAENYVASLWSLQIDRTVNTGLHSALSEIFKPIIGNFNYARLTGRAESLADISWVDKIAGPRFAEISEDVAEIIETHVDGTDLQYPWKMLRENLKGCQVYLSASSILIRPLIPPTWTLEAFSNAKQRIYMSATLGAGGDLERLMGRKKITRLQIPKGWDRQGVGRRFFIFPNKSLNEKEEIELRRDLMKAAGRSLVLVPSERMLEEIGQDVNNKLQFPTFSAADIEQSKSPFTIEKNAVAIVANRYDGIDFPGKECRLLFIEGLPKAMNLQERFIMTRMGANVLFNERIQTRVLQAIGRCTRSLEDYSAVVVSGDDLSDYLSDIRRSKFLHPELQAEIKFGINQSMGTTKEDILENFQTFLENDEAWEEVNQEIVTYRREAEQQQFPALKELADVVKSEIAYQTAMWKEDFEEALSAAEEILGLLTLPELKGYRALWHYLAGNAAWYGAEAGTKRLAVKATAHFGQAKAATGGITWLVNLARFQAPEVTTNLENDSIMDQIEKLESVLDKLGTTHDRKYTRREKEILNGLQAEDSFEHAHMLLGEMLGYFSAKMESPGSPDPYWISKEITFVFEDHAGAEKDSKLSITKARQAASHPKWVSANVAASENTKILPVLITPVKKIDKDGLLHLSEVSVWPLDDFLVWANNSLGIIRKLRKTFTEPGHLAWRAEAADAFKENSMDAISLSKKLTIMKAEKFLVPE